MQKIATPRELQAELKALMAFVHHSTKPDRQVVAAKIRELAERVAWSEDVPDGQLVRETLDDTRRALSRYNYKSALGLLRWLEEPGRVLENKKLVRVIQGPAHDAVDAIENADYHSRTNEEARWLDKAYAALKQIEKAVGR